MIQHRRPRRRGGGEGRHCPAWGPRAAGGAGRGAGRPRGAGPARSRAGAGSVSGCGAMLRGGSAGKGRQPPAASRAPGPRRSAVRRASPRSRSWVPRLGGGGGPRAPGSAGLRRRCGRERAGPAGSGPSGSFLNAAGSPRVGRGGELPACRSVRRKEAFQD